MSIHVVDNSVSRLKEDVAELTRIYRPSASMGEAQAAHWAADRLQDLGLEAAIEEDRAAGSYWIPLGLLTATGLAGGLTALAGRRLLGAGMAGLAAAGIWDDLDLRARLVRRAVARRRTRNVVAHLGPAGAPATVLLVAHLDAPATGLVFHPAQMRWLARRFPSLVERVNTQPSLWAPVLVAPSAAAVGALSGSRRLTIAAVALSALVAAALVDIASRDASPGAIDNASGVAAVLEVVRRLADDGPGDVRVVVVLTGAEESLWEGIQAFGRRHFGELAREQTLVINVDQVGDPVLTALRAEGAMHLRSFDPRAIALARTVAEERDVGIRTDLAARNGSDAQVPQRAGYATVFIGSVTETKSQTNYHWPTDTPDCVDYRAVARSADVVEGIIRRFGERGFPCSQSLGRKARSERR